MLVIVAGYSCQDYGFRWEITFFSVVPNFCFFGEISQFFFFPEIHFYSKIDRCVAHGRLF